MNDKISRDIYLIESLVDAMGNSEGQTVDEVKAELREEGVDVEASVRDLMATVRRCSNEAKRKQLDLARQKRLKRESQRPPGYPGFNCRD